VVNPTTAKKLTNMRTTGSDENILIRNPRSMTLEQALEYIEEDEIVEVTPSAVRIRKELLTENARKKTSRGAKKGEFIEA
jgi:GTP-binding protein